MGVVFIIRSFSGKKSNDGCGVKADDVGANLFAPTSVPTFGYKDFSLTSASGCKQLLTFVELNNPGFFDAVLTIDTFCKTVCILSAFEPFDSHSGEVYAINLCFT